MMGDADPCPELHSYLSAGIALAVHVAPKQFCYRFPEYAISRIAHWSLEDVQEALELIMEHLCLSKQPLTNQNIMGS